MQVTLVTAKYKIGSHLVWAPLQSVGPTYQCLPRPATRELLYNRLSVSLHHRQHTQLP